MSDTPRTDAMEIDLRLTYDYVAFVNSARELERELERENAELQKENAALRKTLAEADLLYEYRRDDGRREWAVVETWINRDKIVVLMDRAAFDAARKEGQSCQCTNGVIRSVGYDNAEVINDCPNCSDSKETKP